MLVQSEAGLLSLTGTEDSPSRVGISIADIAAGMYVYSGVLTALYRRAVSGVASHVKVSLFEALAEWMGSPMYYTKYGSAQPLRVGAEHATIAPYGPYVTSDGNTVMLAIQSQREWHQFCETVLGDVSVGADSRFERNSARVENREALNAVISKRFGELEVDAAVGLLEQARIANEPPSEAWPTSSSTPSLEERNRWAEVGSPVGAMQTLIPPVDIDGVSPRMDPIPALGQHTELILAELGFDPAQIILLKESGAL